MFADTKAFSSFAVDDIPKAKEFYGGTLGIETSEEPNDLLILNFPGDRPTMIYPKPHFVPATYTVLNFPVEDVDAAVEALIARGVTMEQYDGFDQDDKGVHRDNGPTIAWFTDPAGNVLSVVERD